MAKQDYGGVPALRPPLIGVRLMTDLRYPVLPLRDIVVFPQMIVPLFVGREKSVAALEAAMAGDKTVFLLSQKNPGDEDPRR
jgi:ATP-dependent Lon protease